ncbi:MAG: adenosylcobinamide-GDP ribazoletransferase [Dermatophilaceae bacterium]
MTGAPTGRWSWPAEWRSMLLAVQFLTRVPLRGIPWSEEAQARSVRWFPLVGALVGSAAGVVLWPAALVWPALVAAVLSTAAGVLLTGAFHEDGLADTADGLGAGADRARALEIMRDSRLGSYGAVALLLVLSVKVSALTGLLSAASVLVVVTALVAGHALSRASVVVVVATSTYVRDHGTGKPVAQGISGPALVVALVSGALAVAPLAVAAGPLAAVAALGGAAAGHLAARSGFERRLGGYTGDCLGAVQQVGEVAVLLGVLAVI